MAGRSRGKEDIHFEINMIACAGTCNYNIIVYSGDTKIQCTPGTLKYSVVWGHLNTVYSGDTEIQCSLGTLKYSVLRGHLNTV